MVLKPGNCILWEKFFGVIGRKQVQLGVIECMGYQPRREPIGATRAVWASVARPPAQAMSQWLAGL